MARMHSRKRGKSRSRRPSVKVAPDWVEYPAHEVEELVVKLHKEGLTPTSIGLRLRDIYSIPSVKNICNKSIARILKDKEQEIGYPDDLLNLIKRAVRMGKHLEKNRPDKHNRTKLIHVESKIKRLSRYYRRTGRMPSDWVYDPEKAKLLVR